MQPTRFVSRSGLTLAEVLITLVIAAAILTAALGIHRRIERSSTVALQRLEKIGESTAVIRLIAEDLDRAVTDPDGTRIELDNAPDNGFSLARLKIRTEVLDAKDEAQVFQEIIWQGALDLATNRIVLYRSFEGLVPEDRLLDSDSERSDVEAARPFVPVIGGISYLRIEAPQGDTWQDRWQGSTLPTGLRISLSFAQPTKGVSGKMEVPVEDLIIRTVAIDGTRKPKFELLEEFESDV